MPILLLAFFLFASTSFAQTEIMTTIHDIDYGSEQDPVTLIYLASGDVVKLQRDEKMLLTQLQEGLKKRNWFRVTINKEREILLLENILPPHSQTHHKTNLKVHSELQDEPYVPSILKDMDAARSFFYDVRTNPKESQCYNRAHVWAYDWRTKRNLYSSKTWLFFTKRYIRKHKFEWWFHVAPMVHVIVDGEVKERVMDMKYARGPLKLKTWTDIFMKDGSHCPVVQKYSDQANYPESGSCFTMKSSMYYYQPVDLDDLELTGKEKSTWIEAEVRQAFLEALEITL